VPAEARPNGRVARRKASYYAAVASGSDYRTRLTARTADTDQMVSQSTRRAASGGARL
jgi:RNA polymerase sigma factor for flagellar operon FliA